MKLEELNSDNIEDMAKKMVEYAVNFVHWSDHIQREFNEPIYPSFHIICDCQREQHNTSNEL